MANKYTELFRFEAEGMPQDTFHVLSFRGTEGLSSLFSFDIELVSENLSVDLGALLSGSAKLTVKREGAPDAVFAGRPAAARQNGHFENHAYYSVQLRPAFWKFTQLIQSAIFLNKNAPDTVEEIIGSERFFPLKHEMRLTRCGYPNQEFAMQHEESFYDYITWRMEQQGAYFYFAPDGDTVIFSDSPQSHDAPSGTIYYSPATGLEGDRRGEVATSFSLCQTPLPARVVVRSYSWQNPNLPIVAEAPVTPEGFGDVYLAHEPAETKADAARIAEIRAEELRCHSRIFTGTSASPLMRPGALFTLDRHYNEAFNRDYMVTEVSHEGAQEAFISLGLGIPLRGAAEHLFYRNEFRCIESDVPYRPARRAPRAKITGVMRAFVDGAGSGARAETDEYGRYKLVFPFDVSGRSGGNASCWIRMAQQQVGQDSGLALPVQPGTEALVAFEEGDPDRPYISGVLSNSETGSIYGSGNRNVSGLRTAGGNQITINDDDKKQGISLLMPTGNGLMMSAGSSDLLVSSTEAGLTASSVSSTNLAGILQSCLCGFRSITCSTTDPKSLSAWGATTSSMGKFVSDMFSSLSKSYSSGKSDTSEGLVWGAGGVKDLAMALNLILQTVSSAKAGPTSYGVTLTAKDKTSSSLIQAKAGPAELAALITSIILRTTGFAMDIGTAATLSDDDVVNKENENRDKDLYYDKNYNSVSKAAAQRSYTTSSAASLLPEITSLIVMCIAWGKQERKLGGILLAAPDENINLTAKTRISAHADGSILLHAGEMPEEGPAPLNNNQALGNMKAVRKALKASDRNGPTHWGVGNDNDIVEQIIGEDYRFLREKQYAKINNNVPEKSVSTIADLIYCRGKDLISISERDSVDYAEVHHMTRVGNKGATISLKQKQWLGYVPEEGKVKLGTVTGDYPNDAHRVNDNALSGLITNKDKAILQFKDTSSIKIADKLVEIKIKEGPTLVMTKDRGTLKAKTVEVSCSNAADSKINVDRAGVKICDVLFKKSNLSTNGKLELKGSIIKIGP